MTKEKIYVCPKCGSTHIKVTKENEEISYREYRCLDCGNEGTSEENITKCISNTKQGKCEICGKEALLDANNRDKKYVCESCWYKVGYDTINKKYEVHLNGGLNLGTDNKERAETRVKELKEKAKIFNQDWKIELKVQE